VRIASRSLGRRRPSTKHVHQSLDRDETVTCDMFIGKDILVKRRILYSQYDFEITYQAIVFAPESPYFQTHT
jgi:hypothetical protein